MTPPSTAKIIKWYYAASILLVDKLGDQFDNSSSKSTKAVKFHGQVWIVKLSTSAAQKISTKLRSRLDVILQI